MIIKILLMLLFLAIVFPFLFLSVYNNPSADDYWYGKYTLNYGELNWSNFKQIQINHYNSWSGRYTSNALLSINPMVFHSFTGYKIVTLVLIISLIISFGILFKIINHRYWRLNFNYLFLLFISFIFAFFVAMPKPAEGLYWFSGSITYMLPFLLCIGVCILWIFFIENHNKLIFVILFLTIFLIIGSNETTMLYLDTILFMATLFLFAKNSPHKFYILSLLIFAVICSALVILAPGNAIRQSYFTKFNHNIYRTAFLVVKKSLLYGGRWLVYGILTMIISIPIFNNSILRNEATKFISPLKLLFLNLILIGSTILPSAWAMGGHPPKRAENFIYVATLIWCLVFIYNFLVYWHQKNKKIYSPLFFKIVFVIILVVGFFSNASNINIAYSDIITNRAFNYNKQLQERYRFLEKSNQLNVTVDQLTSKPATIYFTDIGSNPLESINPSYALYFHKNKIAVKKD